MPLKPSPPPFDPKASKKKVAAPKVKAKVIKAPKEKVAPLLPKVVRRVTAGPFYDERHPRPHEAWVVITRAGAVVDYHRFRSEDDAKAFAAGFESNP
jgi:hypothetical protein